MSHYQARYSSTAPERSELANQQGLCLIEFGANGCGYCQAAQPLIAKALDDFPDLPHLKIEDGPGRRLGRSFRIKLWPTLILLRDGEEIGRLVRPSSFAEMNDLLRRP